MNSQRKRNEPCLCGSGKKYKKCCSRIKPRTLTINLDVDDQNTLTHMRLYKDGRIEIYDEFGAIVPRSVLISHEYRRKKGSKVLNTVTSDPQAITLNVGASLLRFSHLVAIDTNTQTIGGITISIASIVVGVIEKIDESRLHVDLYRVCNIEFRCVDRDAERYGWALLLQMLDHDLSFDDASIGIIVDAHMNDMKAINERKSPLFGGRFLPNNCELIYATADAGADFPFNKMIRHCDKFATRQLEYIARSPELLKGDYLKRDVNGVQCAVWADVPGPADVVLPS